MAKNYSKHLNNKVTPQNEPIPGKNQVKNSASGFVYKIDKWQQLRRFLILGSSGGTYYISDKDLTKANTDAVLACIKEDAQRVLNEVIDISVNARAPKNDQAIFVMALLMVHAPAEMKHVIADAVPTVCRIGTHLFTFVHYVDEMRSWGRSIRNAVAKWYSMDPKNLEYQLIKYKGRSVEGTGNQWTHRDVLRSAHIKPASDVHNALFGYAVKGELAANLSQFSLISAVEALKTEKDVKIAAKLIADNRIPHEAWPTELKNERIIWEAALPDMPMTALIRNLGKLSQIGVLGTASFENTNLVVSKLTDEALIKKARIHPMSVLIAMKTYAQGQGIRGNLSWDVNRKIVDALDDTFYMAFGNVEPSGMRNLLALDVSGSMNSPISGSPFISCREAEAAMALITMKIEKDYEIVGFTAGSRTNWRMGSELTKLNISPRMRLDTITSAINDLPFGGTDCSLPMVWALKNKFKFDSFIVYTDNETWAGEIHASQALKKYRNEMGIDAKLIVVGMAANDFTIADPNDRGMMDCVGFDTSAPQIISDFSMGRI